MTSNGMISKALKVIAIIALSGIAASCGKKGKSSAADISVSPSEPIVFTGDLSYTDAAGTVVKVKAPWFRFAMSLSNGTDEAITVIGLELKISGRDKFGGDITSTSTFDPSLSNVTTDVLTCTYSDFGEYAAGSSGVFFSIPNGSTGCPTVYPNFIIGSLPDPGQGFYRFRVEARITGWFGTRSTPTDRFDKRYTFYTQ